MPARTVWLNSTWLSSGEAEQIAHIGVYNTMRMILILAILILTAAFLTGCDYGFTFHPEEMTPGQMLQRADLVFIGVIEGQHFDSWPFFRVST